MFKWKGLGLRIAGVTQVVFLVLKLAGLISWSWLWVLSPLWILVSCIVLLFSAIGLLLIICYADRI